MRLFISTLLVLGLLFGATHLTAQPPIVKPGPEHELLRECEGIWDATMRCPAGESKGVLKSKIDLNGLWLLDHFEGEVSGVKYMGAGATSFNPAKKKYVGVWLDSFNTTPMLSEGTYDAKTKTLTMVGEMPMGDGKSMKATMTTVHKDADNKVFTIRGAGPEGKDMEMMQITYKRRTK